MTPDHATIADDTATDALPADGSAKGYRLGDDFAQLRQASIMMVDDEPITMEVVQTFLEDAGYRKFILVEDSTRAMGELRERRPDVLLLDVVMPEVDGFDILQMLRSDSDFTHLPVIILTSSSDAETKLKALDLGATDFLSKPVDPSELALRVRNTLAAKAYQDQLTYYDGLTSLPNRRLYLDRAHWAVDKAQRYGAQGALLHIAFDNFNRVTDAFGPATGDEVLKQLAERLRQNVRSQRAAEKGGPGARTWTEVFRVGGTDFAVLLPIVDKDTSPAVLGRRLLKVLQEPIEAEGTEVYLTPSIGVAGFPDDAADVASLIKLATGACSQAQAQGGGQLQFFSPQMNHASLKRLRIEADLRRALENKEFRLVYQPKVDVASGQIVGTEALIRWHTRSEVVSPGDFIPVAEETGLIVPIGEWALFEACNQVTRWNHMGIDTGVAVNFSARQFFDADLIPIVRAALEQTGIDPARLTLEVTESLLMTRIEQAEETLHSLRQLGVKVSIDDFGTGYSSLSYLKRFSVDEVKIDRSFVKDVAHSRQDQALVAAVTYLARELGLKTCAEGIEEPVQLKFLRKARCDTFQGFLYSRPLPPDELTFRPHLEDPVRD
jgi:diguanylate cyclase (GGDEF)-like protein